MTKNKKENSLKSSCCSKLKTLLLIRIHNDARLEMTQLVMFSLYKREKGRKKVRGKPRRMRRKSIIISNSIKNGSMCLFIDDC